MTMNFTAVNTTEVVLARLAFTGKKAVDCGAGAIAFLELLRLQQARNVYASGFLFDYCARKVSFLK